MKKEKMKIFVSMKVPRVDGELEKLALLTAGMIQQAGHEPFIATNEIAKRGLTNPKEFMPFVRRHMATSDLMIVLYRPELRGGLIEMDMAYAQNIPIWLCSTIRMKVSSSALGCADLKIEYTELKNFEKQLPANLRQYPKGTRFVRI
jgi:hypothetical protein